MASQARIPVPAALVALALAAVSASAAATAKDGKGIAPAPVVLTVGPGGGAPCDHASIQDAIDAAPEGAILRVANTVNWAGSLEIADRSLTLSGGWAGCDDDSPDPAAPTAATSGGPTTLRVSQSGGPAREVTVRNFVLRLGNGGATHGGGLDLSGDLRVVLDNVRVQENSAQFGGGIRIRGGAVRPTLVLDGGSRIGGIAPFLEHNNATADGGGIHCVDGDIEWADASIQFNTAVNGGGIHLGNCTLAVVPDFGPAGRELRIADNRAELGAGGGIFANAGSAIALASDATRTVRVVRNVAGAGAGGGVFLLGATLVGDGIEVERNSAATTGGGVHIASSASLDLDRGNPTGANCGGRARCSSISFNVAGGNGGAVWASGAAVDLRQTFLDANRAADSPGIGAALGATVVLRSVQLAGNVASNGAGTQLLFSSADGFDIRHATIAFNDVDRVFRLILGAALDLTDSIVWQPGAEIVSGDGSEIVVADCVNASDALSFAAATHDPGFEVGAAAPSPPPPLRLAGDSSNLDACDGLPLPNPAHDALGRLRVLDLEDVPDLDGPLDRGAFEAPVPLLSDGFEG